MQQLKTNMYLKKKEMSKTFRCWNIFKTEIVNVHLYICKFYETSLFGCLLDHKAEQTLEGHLSWVLASKIPWLAFSLSIAELVKHKRPPLKCDTCQKKLNRDTGLGIKILSQEWTIQVSDRTWPIKRKITCPSRWLKTVVYKKGTLGNGSFILSGILQFFLGEHM